MECSKIPHLLDVHHGTDPVPAADQTVFARPWIKRLSSSSRPPLLIEEISFYFIYGHNVRGGFLLAAGFCTFIGPSESRSYILAQPATLRSTFDPIRIDNPKKLSIICATLLINYLLISFAFSRELRIDCCNRNLHRPLKVWNHCVHFKWTFYHWNPSISGKLLLIFRMSNLNVLRNSSRFDVDKNLQVIPNFWLVTVKFTSIKLTSYD